MSIYCLLHITYLIITNIYNCSLKELNSIQLYQAYSKSTNITIEKTTETTEKNSYCSIDIEDLRHKVKYIDKLYNEVRTIIDAKLAMVNSNTNIYCNEDDSISKESKTVVHKSHINQALMIQQHDMTYNILPRILQFCNKLALLPKEVDLIHLMIITQGSSNSYVLNTLIEEDYLRRIIGFQRICNLSEIDIEYFCDGERVHIKEGYVMREEDNGMHFNLRVARSTVTILYGYKLSSDDLFKVSQTILEDIVYNNRNNTNDANGHNNSNAVTGVVMTAKSNSTKKRKLLVSLDKTEGNNTTSNTATGHKQKHISNIDNTNGSSGSISNSNGKLDKQALMQLLIPPSTTTTTGATEWEVQSSTEDKDGDGSTVIPGDQEENHGMEVEDDAPPNSSTSSSSSSSSTLTPFNVSNQFEYLDEGFKVIALMVRGNAARLKVSTAYIIRYYMCV